ncbi:hypothetical protein [Pseudomonas aeruginosa]|uniref:hypothetical protein n=1 Tax=Pseudomonas aeruginosa TaxID=287 RepID=UPI001BD4C126|nr:hypothetical protein [Pseudomonas aeruginosa]MBS9730349.1 hypothetical protein [Pseudomonas aeruginosa]
MAYQEYGSTFVHDGKVYHLNDFLRRSETLPVQTVPLKDFEWLLEYAVEEDKDRIKRADYSFPLLITEWEGERVIIDGWHRFLKAHWDGQSALNVKVIPTDWFKGKGRPFKLKGYRNRVM